MAIKRTHYKSPFAEYFNYLSRIDRGKRYSKEYGSILLLSLTEEVGEIARAYLAEHALRVISRFDGFNHGGFAGRIQTRKQHT